jgi:multidrug efflux system membrane fusion protein
MTRPRILQTPCVVRRFGVAGLTCVALSIAALGCNKTSAEGTPGAGGRGGGRGRGGAQPVVTAKVSQRDVPVDIAAVGNVEAYTTISVRSQITGEIQQAFFHEGDLVKKGGNLFKIDPRPLEATLQQSLANEIRDKALLAQAEAQLNRDASTAEYQQLTAERQGQLVSRGIISKDASEQARALADSTAALVKADKAAVESARAQLAVQVSISDNARVQLQYTDIRSPIDGRTGNNTVKVGNLAMANQELVTIAQLEPVYVTFAVPAVHLPTIKRHMGAGAEKLGVVATPQDIDKQAANGFLTFVDNAVDTTTDTIKLKATFPNNDRRLWPGQFARVSLRLTTLPDALVVPSQAVQTGQEGQFVFVVKGDSTVEQRPIVVAQRVSDDVVVEKGLKLGETVDTEGQLRLEQGTRVQTGDGTEGGRGGRGRGRGGRGGERGSAEQGGAGAQGGRAEGAPGGRASQDGAAATPAAGRQGGEGGDGGGGRRGQGGEGGGRRGE